MKLTFANSSDLTVEGTPEEVCQFLALHEKRQQPAEPESTFAKDLPPWAYVKWYNWDSLPNKIRAFIFSRNGSCNIEDTIERTMCNVAGAKRSEVQRIINQHCKLLDNRVFIAEKGCALLEAAYKAQEFII